MAQVKMIDSETDQANANLAETERVGTTNTGTNEAPRKKQKRPVIKWTADANEYLLLAMAETFKEKKVQIPWDEIAQKMGPTVKATALHRHFVTLRKTRQNNAQIVPPGPYLDSDMVVTGAKHSIPTAPKSKTFTPSGFVQRKAATGKKRYRDSDFDSETSEDEEYDPSKGDPDATWSSKPAGRKQKGSAKKVRRLSKSTDVSDGTLGGDEHNESDGNVGSKGMEDGGDQSESDDNDASKNATESTPTETGSDVPSLVVTLKCNPKKLRDILEKPPNPQNTYEQLSDGSKLQPQNPCAVSTVKDLPKQEPEVKQESSGLPGCFPNSLNSRQSFDESRNLVGSGTPPNDDPGDGSNHHNGWSNFEEEMFHCTNVGDLPSAYMDREDSPQSLGEPEWREFTYLDDD